jgi:hypothetical protein
MVCDTTHPDECFDDVPIGLWSAAFEKLMVGLK